MIIAQWLNDEQLQVIRAGLEAEDVLIFDLLIETGFRLDDILHARWRAFDADAQCLTLLERKTRKLRTVPISAEMVARLAARRRSRDALLFPASRAGAKAGMHRTTFWRHFAAAAAALRRDGVDASPHSLRKVYAVRLFKATKSLVSVQKALNHSNVATTALYALSDAIRGA